MTRWEGALFISYYIAFVLYLVMQAGHYEALPRFSVIMLTFVIPLTVVTLIVLTVRTARANRKASAFGTTS